jgi:hypothetical protein
VNVDVEKKVERKMKRRLLWWANKKILALEMEGNVWKDSINFHLQPVDTSEF